MNDDFMFYVKWKDGEKKEISREHIVGILAYINGKYYLKGKNIKEVNEQLVESIFDGIPPYKDSKLHISDDLFEFFRMKIPLENRDNPYEILKEHMGKSHIESYTVEEVNKKDLNKWKEAILSISNNITNNSQEEK